MTLSDDIFESFQLLLKRYKDDYKNGGYEYTHKVIFEEMLFVLLKTLYTCDLYNNDLVMISRLPTDDWIKNNIAEQLLSGNDDDDDDDYKYFHHN